MPLSRRVMAGMLAAALLVVVGGCTRSSRAEDHNPERSLPPTMPVVVGKDLQTVGQDFEDRGAVVEVRLPEQRIRLRYRNTGETTTIVLPAFAGPLRSRTYPTGWDHAIAAQEPTPGAAISEETTVVLVAGRHDGGDPARPFFAVHQDEVKSHGANSCFGCHTETFCSDCHVEFVGTTSLQ